MPEHKFKSEMQKHSFKLQRDSSNGWVYVGIKLNSDQKGHNFAMDLLEDTNDD